MHYNRFLTARSLREKPKKRIKKKIKKAKPTPKHFYKVGGSI